MSNTRPQTDCDSRQTMAQLYAQFRSSELFKPIVQTALTIPAVVTASYPFEIAQILKQTGAITSYRFGRILPVVSSNWRAFGRAYFTNYTQAGAKNAVVTNHSEIHTKLKEGITPKTDGEAAANAENTSENTQPELNLTLGRKVGLTAGTSLFVASADFLATQYWSNKRLALQINKMPAFHDFFSRIHFASLAGPARFAGLFIGTAGVVSGSTLLRDPLEDVLPTAQYGIANPIAAAIIPALLTGPALNVCHVIRANQIKDMKPATMETPSFWATVVKLYTGNNNKLGVFMRGGLASAINAMAIYAAIAGVDYLVNERLFPEEETKVSNSSQAFFTPKTTRSNHTEETNNQNKKPASRI